jgi:hypothetical protein
MSQTITEPRPLRSYDHTALIPTIRPTDVFLCSYPKSGTTWVGYLLAQLLKKNAAEQLGLDSFNQYVPDINLIYTKRGSLAECAGLPDPRFLLCHATYQPLFPKVVYVLRDPRDVMVSYWHYQKLISRDFDASLLEFLNSDIWPCHWDQHVGSWLLPARHPNLVVIRYEDLHVNPLAEMLKVKQLAGANWSDQQILAAIDASRFDRMRAAEDKFGIKAKVGDPRERFIRRGKSGSWKQEMGPAELAAVEDRCGEIMREFGYDPAA